METTCEIVATFSFGRAGIDAAALLRSGDLVQLDREPGNKYDANAIICLSGSVKVGYVPASANPPIAAAMDAPGGYAPYAVVLSAGVLEGGRFRKTKPTITIYW